MSVPGSGWGYDKDIAGSLEDIAETLRDIRNVLVEKEEGSRITYQQVDEAVNANMLGAFMSFGESLDGIVNRDGLSDFSRAKLLRKLLEDTEKMAKMYKEKLGGKAEQWLGNQGSEVAKDSLR